jgi:hypothetical protein
MKTSALVLFLIIVAASTQGQITDFKNPDFNKADSVAFLYPGHSLKDLKRLSDKLTKPLATEEEKFRAIYAWVCYNIEYDYVLYIRNQNKKEKLKDPKELKAWNKKFSLQVFENLREKQKTICTGYAYLLRELATHAGLSCVIIDGYGRTAQANVGGSGNANHSWNAIRLHNKWYLCDVTWSSGAYDTRLSRYIKKFDDSYFLPDPCVFIRSHYPLDSSWMLLQHKPTLQEFLNGPVIYSSACTYAINQLFPETFDVTTTKGEKVSFRFRNTSAHVIEKIELTVQGAETTSFRPLFSKDSSGLYFIDHIFTARGKHVVHFLLDQRYAFSYTVVVR